MTQIIFKSASPISRPFRQGVFIRDYLLGLNPQDSQGSIEPARGAPQVDIRHELKEALRRATAEDIVSKIEEKRVNAGEPAFSIEERAQLVQAALDKIPFNRTANRFQSFVRYFNRIKNLGWVEATGEIETSEVQSQNPNFGAPRIFYRLTTEGIDAPTQEWKNPFRVLVTGQPRPVARPSTVPTISLPERFRANSVPRLTAHMETLDGIAQEADWPEMEFLALAEEVERIREAVKQWVEQSEEFLANEEGRDSPREDRLESIQERIDALSSLQEELDSQDLSAALNALSDI